MSETNHQNGAPVAAVEQNKPAATAKTAALPRLQILDRLNDGGDNGLPAIVHQLSGGDRLFADKFLVCVRNQVSKAWKRVGNSWVNPFSSVPLNSVLDCLYKCAARKILPDGYNAYLVPYNGKNPTCSLQIDYKGLIDCAIREGVILDADAAAVCENDDFVWNCGEVERWTFDFRKPRGPMCGVCAWVVLPNGRKKWHWMENGEIASIRACVRDTGIWDKWPVEMAKKSALRRMFKTLRNSPAVNALLDMDNENFDLDEPVADAPAQAVPATRRRKTSAIPSGGYTQPQIAAHPAAPAQTVEIKPTAEQAEPVSAAPDVAALDDPFAM